MLSHFCVGSNDTGRFARFYDAVLGVLGLACCEGWEEEGGQEWRGWRVPGSQPGGQITLGVCPLAQGGKLRRCSGTAPALLSGLLRRLRA